MRTVKKMTLVALMLVTLSGYAEKRENNHSKRVTKSVLVEFVNVKKGQKLLIKDEHGRILHSEIVKHSGDLSKAFDLNQLNDGTYTIELEKDFEVIIKPFDIKNNGLTYLETKETKIFKPLVRSEKDRLLISQLSLNSNPVKVEIFYEDELIYSETITGEKTVNRIYKFQDESFGNYHTIVKSDNRSYIEYFKL